MFKGLHPIRYGKREVWPLIEGGKGIAASDHMSAGAWAAANGIGTISAVNADSYDENGRIIPQIYHSKTRPERHQELVQYAINGAIDQVKRAHDIASGKGAININILWEMGGSQTILKEVLEQTKGLVTGITCGAGMPYKLSEIAAHYQVYYLPIVSSARAFNALWKRAYSKAPEFLAAVVYEDPWRAGGHNGLSNAEDPASPQPPYERVYALRKVMRAVGIPDSIPIVMAGGVWHLEEWNDWIDNPELGTIAFQFGTRPLVTQESPISLPWKKRLMQLDEGDVLLHRFSPTGFYSSAIKNRFLKNLEERSERQIAFSGKEAGDHQHLLDVGVNARASFWVTEGDLARARQWVEDGYVSALRTPDNTLVFVTTEEMRMIRKDQAACMGCLSQCNFSSWTEADKNTTGRVPDPRSFCIQKTLQDIAHSDEIEDNLMFCGHSGYRFKTDPFYANNFIPTVQQLIDRILTGK
ncbi:2-nitropropane dioxygenase NPD [Zymomonas mobilis subsp. mobilis ZM4 = ATCC 31821]|uniref:2-nitropropane dioxygenase, NPD n=2 Tax=Zymomonas mobilis subsp. mobilis TaxID=120045 RepID=Q5NP19_ZYMMO|nr:nitronate monooxygenase [Zymomonas mobilis]AAV89541.1 2-nitropropane dioxygenase, NPD [Zymomonas mobilis subsp. mobilis ZM4 = ATCC 31821]AEH62233.1 putative dioxygenase [Zymomonas mobilis subsp. mobilis ATCC 10988]AHB09717.1 2-nitropropane dioxygenase-like enzyme [Zymomonas mobilis subsp. mobilis str. CP4 = NRRL B-14023]AHJ70022.1 putative enoyl-[acyl-carrier-protein] reductase II [Zymomonas mobilis subsp. mobilis NRRL B-12526]AHJ71877.1 putative enoyl-[acyl-carrier-protein] reductase II [Z